uniref:Ribosomal protein L2 n=1 Tax=Aureoumbra lagunensis TaxID=44058 RepID=A0A7U0KSF4_9STRA|nr:ribosomal protein L2 [Aureoumbra lagunensis]QQW50417.1 ribosomal protein L2 [Aureoumbra lagunensis]
MTFLKTKKLKNKLKGIVKTGGRNNKGKIVSFHIGGAHKKLYRQISFQKIPVNCIVESINIDPNRTAFLAKLFSLSLKKHFYTLASSQLQKGHKFNCLKSSQLRLGSKAFLVKLPIGSKIHSISTNLRPNRSISQRAAGTFGQIVKKTLKNTLIRFSSGKLVVLDKLTFGFLGSVSNEGFQDKRVKNAGYSRRFGVKPTTRGVAMNPVDHPHGGGEGKSSGGRPSVTPWARPAHSKKN